MNSKTAKELRRISKRVFEEHGAGLMKKVKSYPTLTKVLNKATKDKDVDDKMKSKLKNILESGRLDVEHEEVDRDIEKKLNEIMAEEVDKAIKLGRIPHPKDDKQLQEYFKKADDYVRKNKINSSTDGGDTRDTDSTGPDQEAV